MKKTILITGASSGIGRATAKYFQDKGWNVIATMRNPDEEKELTLLANTLVTRLDVTDIGSITKAINSGIAQFGKIDVLLNNAGYGAYGPLEATPFGKIAQQFSTNVLGLLNVTKEIIPHFRENRNGVIINISSMGGKVAFPLGSLYHGTKFAVEGISESLYYEMQSIGVKVKLIEPGMVNTDFGGRSFNFNNEGEIAEYQDLIKKVFQQFGVAQLSASNAFTVAEVIFSAATDNSSKLRYSAGSDAETIIDLRKNENDDTLIDFIKKQYTTV